MSTGGNGLGAHCRRLGQSGEHAAARWYQAEDYTIVDRNWRCREGEIDIVAIKGPTMVFCEVKTRTSDRFGLPTEAVTPQKQARLRKLAVRYLAEHRTGRSWELRFDVASVMGGIVEVVEGAF